MTQESQHTLQQALDTRYDDAPDMAKKPPSNDLLDTMLGRGSCRDFLDAAVPDDVLALLCAAALASPTKSDLQQRDIILLKSPDQRQRLSHLVVGQAWVAQAPMIAVFCGNNRRQRLIHTWHDVPFANDHLDALFNAATDAAIALGAFVTAAEGLGLGCCPISAIRNQATAVSEVLGLPQHVFPFAGLAIGYRADQRKISKRLPLQVTCHTDHYNEDGLEQAIGTYDASRAETQPLAKQRFVETFGESPSYAWSEDKVRQYSQPERANFGSYIRKTGFRLE